ncbi:hypothetical protein AbraIFM66950_000295 [Aspergillus brasiliensis]|nr:hypothetical protein AbraIFM66950_000295 [Aspergillus brasiliensis]
MSNLRQLSSNPVSLLTPSQGIIVTAGAFDGADKVIRTVHTQEVKQPIETQLHVREYGVLSRTVEVIPWLLRPAGDFQMGSARAERAGPPGGSPKLTVLLVDLRKAGWMAALGDSVADELGVEEEGGEQSG